MSESVSRRQWLVNTGIGVAGSMALPGLLPAMEATRVLGGVSYGDLLNQLERDVTTMRRAAGPIRLCYNENPFGMSPKAKDGLMASWTQHTWYDPPIRAELRATFAKHVGVPADHVLVTQGSSEVLATLALAYGQNGGKIVAPWPTFEDLPRYGTTLNAAVHKVPLDDRFDHDLYTMDAKIGNDTKLVFLCNPNNPTATLNDDQALRDFVKTNAKRTTVIVDEAYYDFVDAPNYRSMVDLVLAGEPIIVSRTASKIHGLAGLRVGFAVARPDILAKLSAYVTGDPNVFGLHAANASLQDTEYQTFIKQKNREGRALLISALKTMGRKVTDSQTNFVFFHAGQPVEAVQAAALAKGFRIGRAFPPYTDWARVSIGTPEEMQQFAAMLPSIL